jgi:predicted RNase H-like HicB family nuclease
MHCTVIIRSESSNRFVARPVGIPEIEASGPTEAEAIEQLKQKLDEWLRDAKVVEITVPTGNVWLDTFGRSAKDRLWEEYEEELERIRREGNQDAE